MKHKFCFECKHCFIPDNQMRSDIYLCNIAERPISLVTGEISQCLPCADVREVGGECGPHGLLWEPRGCLSVQLDQTLANEI